MRFRHLLYFLALTVQAQTLQISGVVSDPQSALDNLFNRERYFLPGQFANLIIPGAPINVSSTIRLRFN